MNIISLLLALLGIVGMGYGLRIMFRQRASIYRQGQMREYEGQAALLVGVGIAAAGAGALIVGLFGWGMLLFGLIGVTVYFAMVHIAERQNTHPE